VSSGDRHGVTAASCKFEGPPMELFSGMSAGEGEGEG
jgi:hypothetical protein